MDPSLGFLTKLVDEDKFNEAKRSGIKPHFLAEDHIAVYNYIKRHYREYKGTPSRDAVIRAFPNFEFGNYKEPLEYFIDALKEQYRKGVLDEKVHAIADVYHRDTQKAEALLREALSQLHVAEKAYQDVSIVASASDRYAEYVARAADPGADGVLAGWPLLDYQTLGWHGEEFIVLVGEKYTGKSWTMLWLAYQALLQGERVLFVTKEMSQGALTRRFDSIYSSVPFDALRRGELTNVEEKRYRTAMEDLAASNHHFVIARQGVNTVEDIEAKAIETDATIIFGDSIYLFMPDERTTYAGETSKRLAISQRCKTTAARLGVPFLVSVQAGRKKTKDQKPDLDNIEWSNAFSQDADTVLYIHKDLVDKELKRLQVHLLKSRDGDITNFFIDTDFERMRFGQRKDQVAPTTEVFTPEEAEVLNFDGN